MITSSIRSNCDSIASGSFVNLSPGLWTNNHLSFHCVFLLFSFLGVSICFHCAARTKFADHAINRSREHSVNEILFNCIFCFWKADCEFEGKNAFPPRLTTHFTWKRGQIPNFFDSLNVNTFLRFIFAI